MATCQFWLPSQLDLTSGSVSEKYKLWKRQIEVYLATSRVTTKPGKVQTGITLNCAGPHDALELYDNVTWDKNEDKDKPDKVFKALQQHYDPQDNEIIETRRFWIINYQEPFDKIFTELQNKSHIMQFSRERQNAEGQN